MLKGSARMVRAGVVAVALGVVGLATGSAQVAPVKIGVVYSYSGATASEGKAFDAALDAWMNAHKGQMNGRPVQLIRRDDTGPAPDVARRMAQELVVQDHVDFLIGTIYTPNALAIEAVSAQAKVPFFISNAATSGILAKDPYAVRFGSTIPQQTIPLARWAAQNGTKGAYIIVSDYAPGIEAGRLFGDELQALGGKVAGEIHAPVLTTDFSPYVQRIKDAKPQAIYTFIVAGSPAVAFFKAVKDAGLSEAGIKIFANGATVDEADLPVLGNSVLGVISSSQYQPALHSKLNAEFLRGYAAQIKDPGEHPDFMAEAGWDVLSAVERCVRGQSGALDADASMAIVQGLKMDTPRGTIQIDPQSREITQTMYIRRAERHGDEVQNIPFASVPAVPGDVKVGF